MINLLKKYYTYRDKNNTMNFNIIVLYLPTLIRFIYFNNIVLTPKDLCI